MKKELKLILTSISLFFSIVAPAQQYYKDYKVVDDYVKSLGSLDTLNMGTISYIVTKKFSDNKDKVRAIFDWIAFNISFDCKAARNNGNEKTTSEMVLKSRKTTSTGYASLFQDMCSVVKIRCLTVDGYSKYSVEEINEVPDEFNHAWVVVQLGQSPESWFYVDPAWGSGYTDDKMTLFTKQFNDSYFFANKTLFNLQHFPNNSAWQLGPGPKSKKDFFAMPLIRHQAYEFGISTFTPNTGLIKAKINKPIFFNFKTDTNISIDIVALEIGSGKTKRIKTVDHTISASVISFSFKFDEEDIYPVTILINNKPVLAYSVEISE